MKIALSTITFLLLNTVTCCQFEISPVNNTVGIYFNELSQLKISNNKWTLLVYQKILPIRNAISQNNKILEQLQNILETPNNRMQSFYTTIKTHVSLLSQTMKDIEIKYSEIFTDTENYNNFRVKLGLFDGIGIAWKFITRNLDATEGEYYGNWINKIINDEHQ